MLLARVNDLSAVAVAIGLTKINFRIVTVFGRRLSWDFGRYLVSQIISTC